MKMKTVLLVAALLVSCAMPSEPRAARPAGLPDDINSRFFDDDPVEEWVGRWEVESREIYLYRHRIIAALGLWRGQRVADIGAGTGLFEDLLSRAVGAEGRVYAVDIAPKFIEHLRARVAEERLANVEPHLCSQDSVDLPPASIDVAFVCDTYHHFESPQATLASLHSALRANGRLVVVDFERLPGVSRPFILGHVRAPKETFRAEIEAAGFIFENEPRVDGLRENYVLRFRRPAD